ncbi:hypothetical protein FRC00_007077 [Tulasnella sp. 408]|nr:hypothetical protein FRC00_007077 [Tulasnella sp. 408]
MHRDTFVTCGACGRKASDCVPHVLKRVEEPAAKQKEEGELQRSKIEANIVTISPLDGITKVYGEGGALSALSKAPWSSATRRNRTGRASHQDWSPAAILSNPPRPRLPHKSQAAMIDNIKPVAAAADLPPIPPVPVQVNPAVHSILSSALPVKKSGASLLAQTLSAPIRSISSSPLTEQSENGDGESDQLGPTDPPPSRSPQRPVNRQTSGAGASARRVNKVRIEGTLLSPTGVPAELLSSSPETNGAVLSQQPTQITEKRGTERPDTSPGIREPGPLPQVPGLDMPDAGLEVPEAGEHSVMVRAEDASVGMQSPLPAVPEPHEEIALAPAKPLIDGSMHIDHLPAADTSSPAEQRQQPGESRHFPPESELVTVEFPARNGIMTPPRDLVLKVNGIEVVGSPSPSPTHNMSTRRDFEPTTYSPNSPSSAGFLSPTSSREPSPQPEAPSTPRPAPATPPRAPGSVAAIDAEEKDKEDGDDDDEAHPQDDSEALAAKRPPTCPRHGTTAGTPPPPAPVAAPANANATPGEETVAHRLGLALIILAARALRLEVPRFRQGPAADVRCYCACQRVSLGEDQSGCPVEQEQPPSRDPTARTCEIRWTETEIVEEILNRGDGVMLPVEEVVADDTFRK